MRKITLFLMSLFLTVGAMAQFADGVYEVKWAVDNRGFLTYHAEDYPSEAKLAGVTYPGFSDDHYATSDEGVELNWYVITSELGNRYLFQVSSGKFLSVGGIDNNYQTNLLSTENPCPLSFEPAVYNGYTKSTTPSYQIKAIAPNGGAMYLCSGCGTAKEGHCVRWETGTNDGGIPARFDRVATAVVDETIMQNAKKAIAEYEKGIKAAITKNNALIKDAQFRMTVNDKLDLNGKASSNSDQNTGGGGKDGGGIAALVDGYLSSYFHSRWGGTTVNEAHYVQIDLGENNSIDDFRFKFWSRSGSPYAKYIVVSGSDDGSRFTNIATFIDGVNNISFPAHTVGDDNNGWESPVILSNTAYRYIRFTVKGSVGPGDIKYGNQFFFGMRELEIYPVEVAVDNEEYKNKTNELKTLYMSVANAGNNTAIASKAEMELLGAYRNATKTEISTKEELSNKGIYILEAYRNNSWMAYQQKGGTDYVVSTAYSDNRLEKNYANDIFCWAIYKSELTGKYYFYNIAAEKFIGNNNENNQPVPLVSEVTNNIYFKASSGSNANNFPYLFSSNNSGVLNHSGDFAYGLINWAGGWGYTDDEGSIHKIVLVDEMDDETLAKIEDLVAEYELPFKYAKEDEEVAEWYWMKLHSNTPKYIKATDDNIEWLDENFFAVGEEEAYVWGFVGSNRTGFKLVNKAYGTDKALNVVNNGEIKMGDFDTAAYWNVVASGEPDNNGYFCLTTNRGNNEHIYMNGQSGKVAFWNANDAGSTILLEEADNSYETGYYRLAYDFGTDNGGVKYAQGTASGVSSKENSLLMNDDQAAASLFYYNSNRLLSYSAGRFLNDSNARGLANINNAGARAKFVAATEGKTKILSGSNYLHAANASEVYYIDHCSSEGNHDHNFTVELCETLPVSISAAKYTTFFAPVEVTVPENVTAYYVTAENVYKGYISLSEIENGVIPANTAVILYAETENTYNLNITNTKAQAIKNNVLKGTAAATYIAEPAYVLSAPDGANSVGLYKAALNIDGNGNKVEENGTRFLNNSHKAYLPLSVLPANIAMSASLRFDIGTTAIEEVETENAEAEVIYDLTGRRVNEITKAGVYIVNGKKVLVK